MESFRFDIELPVRYRDMDALGHVNNAVYATYIEQARIDYIDRVVEVRAEDLQMAMVHIDLDFQQQVTMADDYVTIGCRVDELGDSSIHMAYRVEAGDEGKTAVTGESVQVAFDGESASPIPDTWRESIEAFEPEL
jgi:acyl-CoA thioester hydrolase